MATAQELIGMATEAIAARAAFDPALAVFISKDIEATALVTAEQAAVDAAIIALADALSTARETVGWAAANDAFLSTKLTLETINGAIGALVSAYEPP